jgi:hypothetical protein
MAAKSQALCVRAHSLAGKTVEQLKHTCSLHSCLQSVTAVAAKWQALCARAWPEKRGNDLHKHAISRSCRESRTAVAAGGMASAVRARLAGKTREQFKH